MHHLKVIQPREFDMNSLQKQPPEVFCKKGVLRNFVKFTRKHQCEILFFNKVSGLDLWTTAPDTPMEI